MPCTKCEAKLSKLATPEVKNPGQREVNVNKIIQKRKVMQSVKTLSKCKVCGSSLHQQGKYCASCAHREGRCWMCGEKIFDTSRHNMSLV